MTPVKDDLERLVWSILRLISTNPPNGGLRIRPNGYARKHQRVYERELRRTWSNKLLLEEKLAPVLRQLNDPTTIIVIDPRE